MTRRPTSSLLALAALAASSFNIPMLGPGAYDLPPRQPSPRVRTAADLSRLEAAAAKRDRRAARRLGVQP